MKGITVAVLAILLLVAGGCRTTPDTPKQNVYAAAAMYTATAETTRDMLRSDLITVEQAKGVLEVLRRYRPALEAAKEAVSNDEPIPKDTMEQLRVMQSELTRIQHELQQREDKR